MGCESLRGIELGDALAQRPDDPPAARIGTRAIAVAALTVTQSGTWNGSASRWPEAMSASAMMPIVFWASFVLCVKATNPPETSCSLRKSRLTVPGARLRMSQSVPVISTSAPRNRRSAREARE